MKKRTGIILCVLLFACLLASCGKADTAEKQEASVSVFDLADALKEELAMSNMVPVSQENVTTRYEVNGEDMQEACIYVSANANNADEIAIFRLTGKEGDSQRVLQAVRMHVSQKAETFQALDRSEYEAVQKTLILDRAGCVIMVTSHHPSKAYRIIEEFLPVKEKQSSPRK